MSELSDLTIIIVTYKRHKYALRSMAYWSGKGVKVHYIDGSPEAIPVSKLQGLESNITYHHDTRSVYERMIFSIDLIDTKFATLLSDDEFFLPSGLQACMDELDADPSLVSCTGRTLGFGYKDGRVEGALKYLIMKDYAVEDGDPIERMVYHFRTYTPSSVYAITRVEAWKSAIALMAEVDYSVSKTFPARSFAELQHELSIAFYGKSKVIPHLVWLRSTEESPIDPVDHSLPPFYDLWFSDKYKPGREAFLKRVATHLKANSELEYQVIYDGVQKAFEEYSQIKHTVAKTPKMRARNLKNKAINFVASLMPRWLKDKLRSSVVRSSFTEICQDLRSAGCACSCEELSEVEQYVAEFHQG